MYSKLILAAALVSSANAMCANLCSGHGACGTNDRCQCYSNWEGIDCSERTCPFEKAWADVAPSGTTRSAHHYLECAGKGKCNRESGECECFEGYEGAGCKRSTCPNGCSGHGTCDLISDVNSGYAGWDSDKVQICTCDPGYGGYDCSERQCIRGDDPMKREDSSFSQQTHHVQKVSIDCAAGAQAGTFVLKYHDWRNETWTTWPIEIDTLDDSYDGATGIMVREALVGLPNLAIPSVTVSVVKSSNDFDITVAFTDPLTSGTQQLLQVDVGGCDTAGCQPRFAGVTCNGVLAASTTAVVEVSGGTTEFDVCSSRGKCNFETGLCECHEGFTGNNCATQTQLL